MDRIEVLQVEHRLLLELSAAAPRDRPEVQTRLRLVTAELLRAELTRPLQPVPEHPEDDEHKLRYFQK